MAVLRLVVDRRAALHHLLDFGGIEGLAGAGGAPDFLGERERGTAVAVGHADERRARVGIERQRLAFDRLGARQQLLDRSRVERFEHQHAGARKQRRIQLERWILGGGADQHDGAVLHHRQERILLRAVEAVDLVDEQQRPLPGLAARARLLEHLLEVGDAGEDRGNLLEMQLGRVGEKPRHRGLAGARRPPEDQRAERAGIEHARQRTVRPEQVILPNHLRQRLGRPQLVGQRPRRIAIEAGGSEQAWRLSPGARGHVALAFVIREIRPTSAGRRV